MNWGDYILTEYTCTYKPCGYKTNHRIYKYDKAETIHCPKCKLFTLKPNRYDELEKAVNEAVNNEP